MIRFQDSKTHLLMGRRMPVPHVRSPPVDETEDVIVCMRDLCHRFVAADADIASELLADSSGCCPEKLLEPKIKVGQNRLRSAFWDVPPKRSKLKSDILTL